MKFAFALSLALGILITAPSHADVLQGLIDAALPAAAKAEEERKAKAAAEGGRSTRPLAIACASNSSMRRPANRSPRKIEGAATRSPRAST